MLFWTPLLLICFCVVVFADVVDMVGRKDWTLLEVDITQRDADVVSSTTPPFPGARRQSLFCGISGTSDILLYGGHDGSQLADTWVYHVSSSTWELLSPSLDPGARSYVGFAAVDTDLVALFGGEQGASPPNDVWLFDHSELSWSLQAQVDATGAPTGTKGGSVWPSKDATDWGIVVGGGDTESLLQGYGTMYVFSDGVWASHAVSGDIPSPSYGAATWVNFLDPKNELWLFAGRMESEFSSQLSMLTPFDWSWTRVTDGSPDENAEYSGFQAHPGGRNLIAVASLCNVAIIHGGYGRYAEETGSLAGLWSLDTLTADLLWEGWHFLQIESSDGSSVDTVPPLFIGETRTPGQRSGSGAALLGTKLYLFGGLRTDGNGADLWEIELGDVDEVEFGCPTTGGSGNFATSLLSAVAVSLVFLLD